MSVFVSWAGADREVKNVITAKLREEQIEYFDSDEFCQTDFSRECIEKIRRSKVFIVIVSDASMDPRSYVFNEVVEAHRLEGEGQLNILVYKVTDAPYTERFAFNLNHISDANHVARAQRASGESRGVDVLVKRAKALLQRRLEGNPEKPYDVNRPKLAGSAISNTKYFVEGSRDSVIEDIERAFLTSNVIILSEIFGFGKKSVIRRYVQKHPELSAVEIQGMHDSIYKFFLADLHFSNVNELAFENSDGREAVTKKFEFLKKIGENDLLVVSDVDIDDFDEFVCSLLSELRCKLVFITQSSADAYRDVFPVITVGKMENKHLFELFFHYYRCANDSEKDFLLPYLESFFDDVGGHTKTVELTASVLYKELRATPEQVAARFSSSSDGGRELKSRILDNLRSLLSLESFTKDERQTLLLVSLMANPVIGERELISLMNECGAEDHRAINSLDDHGWITYDPREKTVHIEPIIAQICVREFVTSESGVPDVCLDHFQSIYVSKKYILSSARSQIAIMTQTENFFKLLGLDAICAVIAETKNQILKNEKDFERVHAACSLFSSRYGNLSPSDGEEDSLEFEARAALFAYRYFFAALKCLEHFPSMYNFSAAGASFFDEVLKSGMGQEIHEEFSAIFENGYASDLIAEISRDPDFEEPSDLASFLCVSAIYAVSKKDFESVQNIFQELSSLLNRHVKLLENDSLCQLVFAVMSILYQSYRISGAYQAGAAFYESLLANDWPDDVRYRLLLQYCELLLLIGKEEEMALCVLASAEELFDSVTDKQSAEEANSAKVELSVIYATALVRAGELDAAIERYNVAKELDKSFASASEMATLIQEISDYLLADDVQRAIGFIEDNRDLILTYAEAESVSENCKESLSALLSVEEMYEQTRAEGFSAGGIFTDDSYYQKYSKDKKSSIFLMMSYSRIAEKVKRYDFSSFSDAELSEHSQELFSRADSGESMNSIMPEAFALVSEAGFRTLGYRHHQVQYMGAAAMLDGRIAEILNGEGKTYTIVLAAYVSCLYNKKTLVIDSSQYLTKRNYDWMKSVYGLLGVDVGYLPSYKDYSILCDSAEKRIIYTDTRSFIFSVLYNERSSMAKNPFDLSEFCAIIDEADSTLIEAAKTSYKINEPKNDSLNRVQECRKAFRLAKKIEWDKHLYSINKVGSVSLNREVRDLIEKEFDVDYESIAEANAVKRHEEDLKSALYYLSLVEGKDFYIKNDRIYFENSATGSLFEAGARAGYFLAAANKVPEDPYLNELMHKSLTVNCDYLYGIFSRLGRLCGTSATVCSFKKEFKDIYGLDVVAIPPALPISRVDRTVGLYIERREKLADIVGMIAEKHSKGQPVLLITESINESSELSQMLTQAGIEHAAINGLNAEKSPEIFASAGSFNSVTVATQIANRGVDVKLGGDAMRRTVFELVENGVDVSYIARIIYSLPSEEIKSSELYRRYTAAFERNKALVAADRKKVIEAGGLCVISTSAYTDMRVEQQVRGRAGRQGEVGESYVFMSMEDRTFASIGLADIKESAFFRANAAELRVVDTNFLKKRIEGYKQKMHHRTFAEMKNADLASRRIRRSKEKLFALVRDLYSESFQFDKLIEIWSCDGENIISAQKISEGSGLRANEAVDCIFRHFPEHFEGFNEGDAQKKLFKVASHYVTEAISKDQKKRAELLTEMKTALAEHLTEMQEAEESYNTVAIKNVNKFFDSMYENNLEKQISAAVGRWLARLEPDKPEKNILFSEQE